MIFLVNKSNIKVEVLLFGLEPIRKSKMTYLR